MPSRLGSLLGHCVVLWHVRSGAGGTEAPAAALRSSCEVLSCGRAARTCVLPRLARGPDPERCICTSGRSSGVLRLALCVCSALVPVVRAGCAWGTCLASLDLRRRTFTCSPRPGAPQRPMLAWASRCVPASCCFEPRRCGLCMHVRGFLREGCAGCLCVFVLLFFFFFFVCFAGVRFCVRRLRLFCYVVKPHLSLCS